MQKWERFLNGFKLINYIYIYIYIPLNIRKIQFMFFHGRRYIGYASNILINDCPVSKTDCIKFLGIMVDQHLSWRAQIDYISKRKMLNYLDTKISRVCITLWYTHILFIVMKCGVSHMRLTKIAYSYRRKELLGSYVIRAPSRIMHTGPLFIDIGILKLKNLNHYVLQLFMFRFPTTKLPVTFDDMFTRNYEIHSHDTRQRFYLHAHLPETNLVKMSVCCTAGVTIWNYYVKFIDTYCSLDVYKKGLKMYLHKHQWKCS